MFVTADGAATVETLRAELARAKEQPRSSNAAPLQAAEELIAEQAAHCESKEKIANMAVELKDAADRYWLLEKKTGRRRRTWRRPGWLPRKPGPKLERRRRS